MTVYYKVYHTDLGFFIGYRYHDLHLLTPKLGEVFPETEKDTIVHCIAVDTIMVSKDDYAPKGLWVITRWSRVVKPSIYPGDIVPNQIRDAITSYGGHDVHVFATR